MARNTLPNPQFDQNIKALHKQSRKLSKNWVRAMQNRSNMVFNSLISTNPSNVFWAISRLKLDKNKSINFFKEGKTTYRGDCVKDGFYHSLSSLESPPTINMPNNLALYYKLIFC